MDLVRIDEPDPSSLSPNKFPGCWRLDIVESYVLL